MPNYDILWPCYERFYFVMDHPTKLVSRVPRLGTTWYRFRFSWDSTWPLKGVIVGSEEMRAWNQRRPKPKQCCLENCGDGEHQFILREKNNSQQQWGFRLMLLAWCWFSWISCVSTTVIGIYVFNKTPWLNFVAISTWYLEAWGFPCGYCWLRVILQHEWQDPQKMMVIHMPQNGTSNFSKYETGDHVNLGHQLAVIIGVAQ